MNSESYKKYLQSPEWQKKRSERLKIDGYKCQRCGSPYFLQVHHITYMPGREEEDVYKDLITLCNKCHSEIEEAKKTYSLESWYENEQRIKRRDELIEEFIEKFREKDVLFGGKENLCKYENIQKYWVQICDDEKIRGYKCKIQNYFIKAKIAAIKKWKAQGAEKSDIRRMGISEAMINEYY